MDTAAKAMAAVGQANNPAEIQRIMQQFQRENAKMDMAGEMMDDALDSAFDTDEMEDETDDVMNQVNICFFWNMRAASRQQAGLFQFYSHSQN